MSKSRIWTVGVYVELDDPRCAGSKTLTVSGPMVDSNTTTIEKAPVDKLLDETIKEIRCFVGCRSEADGWINRPCNCGAEKLKRKLKEFRSNE